MPAADELESTLFLVRVWHRTDAAGTRRFCASVSAAGSRSAQFFDTADDVARFLDAAGQPGAETAASSHTGGSMTTLRTLAAVSALLLLLPGCNSQSANRASAPLDPARTVKKADRHQPQALRTTPPVAPN